MSQRGESTVCVAAVDKVADPIQPVGKVRIIEKHLLEKSIVATRMLSFEELIRSNSRLSIQPSFILLY